MITQKTPDQVSVVMFKKPQWHQSQTAVSTIFSRKASLSVFGIRAEKLCLPEADLRNETFPAKWQESSVYSTVLYSYDHEQHFPE